MTSTMNMGLALGENGSLYTWGYGNHFNDVARKDEPTKLFLPKIGNIVKMDPGEFHFLMKN